MKKSTTAIFMIIYLLAITLAFSVISALCNVGMRNAFLSQDGIVDLTGIDFDKNVAAISTDAAFIYDGAFYTPEDFASGEVTQDGKRLIDDNLLPGDFGTVRFVLKLPAGEVYALSSKSAAYAQRLFINGKEYASVGVTGDAPGTVIPKVTRYTQAFLPQDDTTEIVLHYSNFVHSAAGSLYAPNLGYADNMSRIEQLRTFQVVIVTGALMTAMLFFFGLFLFFHKSRYLFWFSLTCGCIALRGLITGDRALMLLAPDLGWYAVIRLEYLSVCGLILFAALYLSGLFSGAVNKWAVRGFVVFIISNAAFYCLTPPIVFTRVVWFSLAVVIGFFCYSMMKIFTVIARKKESMILSGIEQVLLVAGLSVFLILSGLEIYAHEKSVYLLGLDYAQVGMMIFLFINLLTLALGFSRTERKLDAALHNKRELEESNRMLERLDRAKNDFLQIISHEMKTPLAVMSNSAGVTLKQIRRNAMDTETEENLNDIQNEAVRLGELVEQLMKVSLEKQRQLALTDTGAMTLLKKAAAFCEPICQGNGNRITVHAKPDRIPLRVDADGIFQVFINLITNANKYTHRGVITLNAKLSGDNVLFTVSDNGEGIAPALKSTVFQRGISGDGGTGLGLAICKEIVEEHGGEICIQSDAGKGTAVCFTLPCTGRSENV